MKGLAVNKKFWRKAALLFLTLFILMNVVAFMHAWRFTHFSSANGSRVTSGSLSFGQKLKYALTGVPNPRPQTGDIPRSSYKDVVIDSTYHTSAWFIPADSSKGTIVLLHGYGGEKSSMLDKASILKTLGWNCLLIDFRGGGASPGTKTSIGYYEAEQVAAAVKWLADQKQGPVWLFGTSMGAAAALRAIAHESVSVSGLVLECPFATLYGTTAARFRMQGVPAFPMAGLIVFWGGVQQGFNGFAHNPVDYAREIKIPTLLMWGEKDPKVSANETAAIFDNLKGPKLRINFPNAGHENYLLKYKNEWTDAISGFLAKYQR